MKSGRVFTIFSALFFIGTVAIAIPIVKKELFDSQTKQTTREESLLPPQPTPVIVIPEWKTFMNPDFSYSIQYPAEADYVVNPATSTYRHFVTFYQNSFDENEEKTVQTELFSLSFRPTSLDEEVVFQRKRIEEHDQTAIPNQHKFLHKGLKAVRVDYQKLILISIAKSPYVATLYFPDITEPSFADRVLSTLTFF